MHTWYLRNDLDGNRRLTWTEIEAFCSSVLGGMPAILPDIWEQVKYQSGATGGVDCVDVVREEPAALQHHLALLTLNPEAYPLKPKP